MASNTIIECSSSSSHAILTYEYDVFVSFRGEDTRNNFTGFLFQSLHGKGINVFKDDQHLNKGESIAPELLQAIQGSRIFVVVFSKNYASSTWCLRELAEICNCNETSQRQVVPIFYDVDPSEVRKQSGYYDLAFTKHKENFREDKEKMEEVLRWRKTLSKVADFCGWHIGNKPQYAKIEEIAQNIKEKLGSKFSSLPKDNLVGMESRVEELASHLESDNDVRFVGISGMGGVGKTTLARALYEQISHQFDAHCFIDDVSHTYRKYPGALGVQKLWEGTKALPKLRRLDLRNSKNLMQNLGEAINLGSLNLEGCSSSSHAIQTYEYDVFVSFRGEDTRNNFTGFLFQALHAKGINVFKDDQHLNKGESIAELFKAIRASRIFVVVFSKDYASSTWCLRELAEMYDCSQTSQRQVVPIFYDVDPSEVRKQSGYYGRAFAKHKKDFKGDKKKMEDLLKRRKTLSKVADFCGWHIGNNILCNPHMDSTLSLRCMSGSSPMSPPPNLASCDAYSSKSVNDEPSPFPAARSSSMMNPHQIL